MEYIYRIVDLDIDPEEIFPIKSGLVNNICVGASFGMHFGISMKIENIFRTTPDSYSAGHFAWENTQNT